MENRKEILRNKICAKILKQRKILEAESSVSYEDGKKGYGPSSQRRKRQKSGRRATKNSEPENFSHNSSQQCVP
jgi:hypothetical protein